MTVAGIVEPSKHWFDTIEPARRLGDPWKHWYDMLQPPNSKIEPRIDWAIRNANSIRLHGIAPTTRRFAAQWDAFRRYHEDLERNNQSRRLRYLVWRGAALTLFYRGLRFDDSDAPQIYELLAETMSAIRPDITADGWCREGGNFWQLWITPDKDGEMKPDPLSEYAVLVMSIMKRVFVWPQRRPL
jgi:hypothetical protein